MTYIGIIINQEVHVRARKEVFADSFTRNCSEGNLWHYTACDPFGKSGSRSQVRRKSMLCTFWGFLSENSHLNFDLYAKIWFCLHINTV